MHGECSHPLIGGELESINGVLNAFPIFLARDMVITDMGMSMIILEEVDLGSASANVYMQLLYKYNTANFVAIPETKIVLTPMLTGNVSKGHLLEKIVNNLNIPVAAGSRLMLIIHKDVIQEDDTKSFITMMSGSVYLRDL